MRLALSILFQVLAAAPWGAPLSAKETPPDRLILETFEPAAGLEKPAGIAGVPPDAVHARVVPSPRPGSEGHSLRVDYALPPSASDEVGLAIDLGGRDVSPYDHLELWIRGDEQAGFSTALKVGFRQRAAERAGLLKTGTRVVTGITGEWQQVLVPLSQMSGIRDWSRVDELFLAFEPRRVTAERGAYFLDDVALIRTGRPGSKVDDFVPAPRKQAWEESHGGRSAALAQVQARLGGWPTRLVVGTDDLPADDRELALRFARDTWRGLEALTEKESGLPIDHIRFDETSLDAAQTDIGDYTSPTSIGLQMIAIVAAIDLGFLPAPEAQARIVRILDSLAKLETYRGFFFNYYDAISLERTSNLISFVDSAWLTAGFMVARAAFPELQARLSALIDAGNYGFFYDGVKQQMSHGYYVNVPTMSEYHYGVLYTEARLGCLIAIGKGDAPEALWFHMVRTFPADETWQTMAPLDRKTKTVLGFRFDGGTYEWRGERYVPSWGGSMFEALMPTLLLDEMRHAPESLGRNDVVHTTVQRRYALEMLGDPVWGLSASASPKGGYAEHGVPVLGSLGYPPGAVTPHAAMLALAVEPDAALANLRLLATRYRIYGEYGFYDAVDPRSGKVAYELLTLDQTMSLIALANHLTDGSIQKRFAADPIVQKVLPVLAAENFFD